MRIALIHKAKYPVQGYGGTERLVWWIAKGLNELGAKVTLVGDAGSECPFADVVVGTDWDTYQGLPSADVYHYFNTPSFEVPSHPYLVTIGGNGKDGETFLLNTVFVSQNHADRHGADCFVHNAVDPSEYHFSDKKKPYLVFLAKASWRVKNVRGAISYARKASTPLHILGGDRFFFRNWRGVHWEGTVDGENKALWLSEARGLLFPVLWHEPFGLAVVEAFASGTPVLASPFGSLPELVAPDVGRLCRTDEDFIDGIRDLGSFKPKRCYDWMMEKFHYHRMAKDYLKLYEKVLNGEKLNRKAPKAIGEQGSLMPISRRPG